MTEFKSAQVGLPLALDKTLTYAMPPSLQARVRPGVRVLVPLGASRSVGVVVALGEESSRGLKDILEVLDDSPLLDPPLLEFTRWISDYYFAPWGQVLQAALPLELRLRKVRRVRLLPAGREILEHPFSQPPGPARRILDLLARRRDLAEARLIQLLPGTTARRLDDLRERGWVEISTESRLPLRQAATEEWVGLGERPGVARSRGARQRLILDCLRNADSAMRMKELCSATGAEPTLVRKLAREGKILLERRKLGSASSRPEGLQRPNLSLTAAQAQATAEISLALEKRGFHPFLLEGVTGSGKTEVYLRAAEKAGEMGLQTLYLVPEIGLTPLLAAKLEVRFGAALAVIHSGLSDAARWEALQRIREGNISLVVGTRSAIFAPLPRLGLMVVDEEQDSSYYQAESPRYHARDAALVRGQRLGAVVVLGSATPSLEAVAATRRGKFRRLVLPSRVQSRELPEVRLVDMREEFRSTGAASLLSRELSAALTSLSESGDQGMLLLNRRGYATFMICRACGITLRCASCSIALTYHRVEGRLFCHYCNRGRAVPTACPACRSQHLQMVGAGTQRLEETIRQLNPSLRIGRLDRDAVKGIGPRDILERFQRHELDLLVGTQMLAKGHDFPRVTLVGVLFADALLAIPEFRAAERTYQLLAQVAGRAGRGERAGKVFVQAYDVQHPALVAAASHRPDLFYDQELRIRRLAEYPPWVSLLQIRVENRSASAAASTALLLCGRLRAVAGSRFKVLGPAPAPLWRLKGRYRQQILLKGSSRRAMAQGVREVLAGLDSRKGLPGHGVIVEPDPQSLL